ncbi:MAG: alpha/beta fold hydrolase [Acidobacteria bacterium]|nr:alpha/beta fold hydrolase [Acidobacteriota bacterium]
MLPGCREGRAINLGVAVALMLAFTGCSGATSSSHPAPPRVQLASCSVEGVARAALCGSYEVWENRASARGRRIPLNIVVIPAAGRDRQKDPVYYFDGGPGVAATSSARRISALLPLVSQSRDLVFVDLRGTGRSHPLNCAVLPDDAPLPRHLDEFLSDDYVRECLARQDADVRFYTQPIAVDDINEVRAALGHERINVFGASAGSRQAQLYMRRHPSSVRSASFTAFSPWMRRCRCRSLAPWMEVFAH